VSTDIGMAQLTRQPDETDYEKQAEVWMTSADDDVLGCRASGHAFPKIRATRAGKLPKGVSARRQWDGCYQLTSVCRDCGTERTITTLPGGMIDLPAHYKYVYPVDSEGRNRYAAPKGTGGFTSRRECLREAWRRALETIQTEGGEAASETD
jgi:hypothetical protein